MEQFSYTALLSRFIFTFKRTMGLMTSISVQRTP